MSKPKKLGSLIQQKTGTAVTSLIPTSSSNGLRFEDLIQEATTAKELQATQANQSAIEALQQKLEAVGGKYTIALNLIDPDPNQPRKTFPKAVVEERAESLTRNGQISPIILIPQDNGRYLLFEGELRYRAAVYLSWSALEAVFLPSGGNQSIDADRFKKQMLTSAHAQRLHDLDLAEGILRLVELCYPNWVGRTDELPRVLNTAITRLKRSGRLDELRAVRNVPQVEQHAWIRETLKEDEQPLFEVILGMQYSPDTILKNAFPLLSITDDLKELVRSTGLESSKVRELQKLNTKTLHIGEDEALAIRSQVAQEVAEDRLSLNEIKAKVAQTIQHYTAAAEKPPISPAIKKVRSLPVVGVEPEELRSLKEALLEKAKEIEIHLSNL